MNACRRGFTILELAIVILIIGLLVGGAFTAQSLIATANLQKVVAEYTMYNKAFYEFQEKYQALPGDMNNAQTIWGSLDVMTCVGGTAVTTLPVTTSTCNGNANGQIGWSAAGSFTSAGLEWVLFWKHLSNAGMIDGRFTGAAAVAWGNTEVMGLSMPVSGYTPGSWKMFYYVNVSDHTTNNSSTPAMWGDSYGHMLAFGDGTTTNLQVNPILTPAQAWEIDSKIDDGFPGLGKVRTWRNEMTTVANCNDTAPPNSNTQSGVRYNLDYTEKACSILFKME